MDLSIQCLRHEKNIRNYMIATKWFFFGEGEKGNKQGFTSLVEDRLLLKPSTGIIKTKTLDSSTVTCPMH